MEFTNYINEIFSIYKIEKFNINNQCWEYYYGSRFYYNCKKQYKNCLKNNSGVYRLIKTIYIGEKNDKK